MVAPSTSTSTLFLTVMNDLVRHTSNLIYSFADNSGICCLCSFAYRPRLALPEEPKQ